MKGVLWFVRIVCFLLLFVAASLVKEARVSSHSWVYVVETDLGMKALSKADYYRQRVEDDVSTESFAQAIYEPSIKRGPVEGAIEWYATESIFDFPSNHFVYHQLKTQEEIDEAYQALIDYANADSAMVQFRPGLPAQTRLSIRLFGFTVLRLLIFAGLSTIAALIVRMIWNLEVGIRRAYKRNMGLCERCGYPVAGLTSPICPECGLEHETGSGRALV